MRSRWPLAILFIVAGLALPLLAAAVVPRLRPGISYGDAVSLIRAPRELLLFSAISSAPFLILAVFAVLHLRAAERITLRRRLFAILFTFAALVILGFWCYAPDTSPGVNFASVFFPAYAVLTAAAAYGVGRVVGSIAVR